MAQQNRVPAEEAMIQPRTRRGARSRPDPRHRVVSRLWQTAERQVREVESRLKKLRDDPVALERDAKTLAILARTVRELVALDEGKSPPGQGENAGGIQNLSIDEFRRELAQKLEQLRVERAGEQPS